MSRSLRLTFLITDLHRGGSPLLLADLAPGLLREGFDVEVVSIAKEGEVASLLRERGVPVFSLAAEGPRDISALPRFVHHLRRSEPDIVTSVLIHANLLAAMARPFVERRIAWCHSIHTVQRRPRWHWYLQGVLNRFADSFVAPSHAVVREMEKYGPVPRPTVIPNGIDVARFKNATPIAAADRPWPAEARIVGYIGRFDPVKRLPVLVQAAAWLPPDVHVALVGYGPEEGALRKMVAAAAWKERVHFLGRTTTPERWYKAFDVFCSPSPAEGFGLTLAEAAVAGVPVVACDTAAVRETLENGVWIPEDATPQAVARAIASVFGKRADSASYSNVKTTISREVMVKGYSLYFAGLMNAWRR